MIIDALSEIKKYQNMHPLFVKAFEYLLKIDFSEMEQGKYELQGDDLFYLVMQKKGITSQDSILNFECHNEYIDIQVCISGQETFGWKPRKSCRHLKETVSQGDNFYFKELPDTYFHLIEKQFVIFFPGDVHASLIGEGDIKKVVMKVKVN